MQNACCTTHQSGHKTVKGIARKTIHKQDLRNVTPNLQTGGSTEISNDGFSADVFSYSTPEKKTLSVFVRNAREQNKTRLFF